MDIVLNEEEEDPIEAILDEINPRVRPNRKGQNSPYYVSEADMYSGVLHLYETGEFPEALAADLLKMCRRIVTSRRFHGYPDTLKEEMVSSASVRVCTQLQNHKYDPYKGSKVYSWATRVIMNDMLQLILKEESKRKKWEKLLEDVKANGTFERVETPREQ